MITVYGTNMTNNTDWMGVSLQLHGNGNLFNVSFVCVYMYKANP